MSTVKEDVYIYRTSIIDKNFKIFGYKLMFYEEDNIENLFQEKNKAFSKKAIKYVANFGVESFTGDKLGFIPVDEEAIENEILEILPAQNVYYELINVEPSFTVLEHLQNLKKKGYKFTIDDNLLNESFLNCVDIVEVNAKKHETEGEITNIIGYLKERGKKLIITDVSSEEEFEKYKNLGFDFFCGDFITEKKILENRKDLSPSKIAVLELYNQIFLDVDISKIEKIFKKNPDLSYKLLKLINSAFFGLRKEVSSIRHALVLLGLKNLKKWVLYILYAEDFSDIKSNPYFVQAILRAKMMEKICEKLCSEEDKEKAYLAGIISNLDAVLNIPLTEVLNEIKVDNSIKEALIEKKGTLGKVYKLVLGVEKEDYDKVRSLSKELGISITDILLIETLSIVEVEKSKV